MLTNRSSVNDFQAASFAPATSSTLDALYQRPLNREVDHMASPLSVGMSEIDLTPPAPFPPWRMGYDYSVEAGSPDDLIAKINNKLAKAQAGSIKHLLLNTGLESSLLYKTLFDHRGDFESVHMGVSMNYWTYGQKAGGVPNIHYDYMGDRKFEAKLDEGWRHPQLAMATPFATAVFPGLTADEMNRDLKNQYAGYAPLITKKGRKVETVSAEPGEYFVMPELTGHATPDPAHPSMPRSQKEAYEALGAFPETHHLLGEKKVSRLFVTTYGMMKPR